MTTSANILLIEDDRGLAAALNQTLTDAGYEVSMETRGDAGLARAQADSFDLIITDLKLPGLPGLELIRQLHLLRPRLPILVITAHGTTETAIEAIQFGAYEYLLKPFEIPEFLDLVGKAVASSRLMSEPVEWGGQDPTRDALVGNSRPMQAIYKAIGRIAAKPVPVLLRGETGTGKDLIARAIYHHSNRAQAPFIAVNCAALPETLLESELFGHERGAFTGADIRRIGRFEQAHRGTIFLDEIGDMSPSAQVKLLRVLQEKNLQRLGGTETISVDVRVIAATHRDLDAAIRQATFREDLFYRLNVAAIDLPPLRDHKEDIPDLVRYFLNKYGAELEAANSDILPEAMELLQGQSWPGNVRELENTMRKTLLLARGYAISPEHVRTALNRAKTVSMKVDATLRDYIAGLLEAAQLGELPAAYTHLLDMVERELFTQAIQSAHGNQAKAARWLGISRLTMQKKLLRYGIHPAQDPSS